MSFRYGGLFSGIGGLELACEALGGEPIFMCENEPFCQQILRKRFPGVHLIEDVRELDANDVGAIDVLVGGSPCQGFSSAGKGLGLKDSRSGLWSEFFRVICDLRPKLVFIENVALLRSRGLDVVLCNLDSIGYAVEWDVIPAAAVGAPHLRERIWITARPKALAQLPVYDKPAVDKHGDIKPFSMVRKLPRAGRMNDSLEELVPIAPRKTKRKNGWSHWVGVNLLADNMRRALWGTPNAHPRTHTPRDVDHGIQLANQVDAIEQGHALLPTPNANGNGNTPANHMRKKAERCGGPRFTITDLEVLARNEFKQANGRLWPTTTTTDARGARNESAARPRGSGKHHSGRTLIDALILEGDLSLSGDDQSNSVEPTSRVEGTLRAAHVDFGTEVLSASSGLTDARTTAAVGLSGCWPTPTARLGASRGAQGKRFFNPARSNDLDDAVVARGSKGSLNPTWVEWLMGLPLWWTDPDMPTPFTTQLDWSEEPLHIAPRVAAGVPYRSQRLKAIGNAVVWKCAYVALERALKATPSIGTIDLQEAA